MGNWKMDTEIEKLRQMLASGVIGRREFLMAMGAIGAGATAIPLLSACGSTAEPTATTAPAAATSAPAAATQAPAVATTAPAGSTPAASAPKPSKWAGQFTGKDLTVVSYGGAYQDAQKVAFFDTFAKDTGANIKTGDSTDYGKIKAMVESGNIEWDVVDVGGEYPGLGGKQNLLEKLDYTVIDKTDVFPGVVEDYGIGTCFYATALAYNTGKYPTGPTSWADFWDVQKFPGRRALYFKPTDNLEFALMADGVAPDKVYETLASPDGVDRAFKKLDQIKPSITVWWEKGAQPAQLLTDGEVDMTSGWNGRFDQSIKDGKPIKVNYQQALLAWDSWVVPKGTQNKDLAMAFIAFSTLPEYQAIIPTQLNYGPVNKKAFDLIDPKLSVDSPSGPKNAGTSLLQNPKWWNDNYDVLMERFTSWRMTT